MFNKQQAEKSWQVGERWEQFRAFDEGVTLLTERKRRTQRCTRAASAPHLVMDWTCEALGTDAYTRRAAV